MTAGRTPFVELGVASCFSFLRGASDAAELALTACVQGYDAIGIADLNTLAGVVRLHAEARKAGLRPVIGCRIALAGGETFLAYPKDRHAYGRLSRLLSKGKMRDRQGNWQKKGVCDLVLDDLAAESRDLQLIAVPPGDLDCFARGLPGLAERLPNLGHIVASCLYRGEDRARINRLDRLAAAHGLGILATNDVLYHEPARRPLQDVMTCIREKCTLATADFRLEPSAERYLKPPREMIRLFAEWPHAVRAARDVADACRFDLEELAYEYPREAVPEGMTPLDRLEQLTWRGAQWRYPDGVSPEIVALLKKELAMIEKLDIARYFLTVHELVRFARYEASPPILCQGRGSAANSAVCYVLGITAVDPARHDLLFERFISEERKEPPDIDVDFEHERREEVIQHIYGKYGRDRAGLCATVIHYRPRSAIREVGKVMGLSEDVTGVLAKTVWGSRGHDVDDGHANEAGLDMADPVLRRTILLARQLIGMPRHLGQHVGGFILTERPLTETVPIGNGAMAERSFIEWDKDDIDTLGILKIDILALGMLTCIRKCFDLIEAYHGQSHTLASVPQEDPRVYDMLCRGDSVGVFQVESRAQMNMLPRLRPRRFYDLVIEVAIVRPGPIQGDMVHPYLRRRSGRGGGARLGAPAGRRERQVAGVPRLDDREHPQPRRCGAPPQHLRRRRARAPLQAGQGPHRRHRSRHAPPLAHLQSERPAPGEARRRRADGAIRRVFRARRHGRPGGGVMPTSKLNRSRMNRLFENLLTRKEERHEPMSTSALATATGLKRIAAYRLLADMEARAWIQSVMGQVNGRAARLWWRKS